MIILIIGATRGEDHIRKFRKQEEKKGFEIMTLSNEGESSPVHFKINLEKPEEMKQLLKIKNQVVQIIFDYSVLKLVYWDTYEIMKGTLGVLHEILEVGGKLFIDNGVRGLSAIITKIDESGKFIGIEKIDQYLYFGIPGHINPKLGNELTKTNNLGYNRKVLKNLGFQVQVLTENYPLFHPHRPLRDYYCCTKL